MGACQSKEAQAQRNVPTEFPGGVRADGRETVAIEPADVEFVRLSCNNAKRLLEHNEHPKDNVQSQLLELFSKFDKLSAFYVPIAAETVIPPDSDALQQLNQQLEEQQDAQDKREEELDKREEELDNLKMKLHAERDALQEEQLKVQEDQLELEEEKEKLQETHAKLKEEQEKFREELLQLQADRDNVQESQLKLQEDQLLLQDAVDQVQADREELLLEIEKMQKDQEDINRSRQELSSMSASTLDESADKSTFSLNTIPEADTSPHKLSGVSFGTRESGMSRASGMSQQSNFSFEMSEAMHALELEATLLEESMQKDALRAKAAENDVVLDEKEEEEEQPMCSPSTTLPDSQVLSPILPEVTESEEEEDTAVIIAGDMSRAIDEAPSSAIMDSYYSQAEGVSEDEETSEDEEEVDALKGFRASKLNLVSSGNVDAPVRVEMTMPAVAEENSDGEEEEEEEEGDDGGMSWEDLVVESTNDNANIDGDDIHFEMPPEAEQETVAEEDAKPPQRMLRTGSRFKSGGRFQMGGRPVMRMDSFMTSNTMDTDALMDRDEEEEEDLLFSPLPDGISGVTDPKDRSMAGPTMDMIDFAPSSECGTDEESDVDDLALNDDDVPISMAASSKPASEDDTSSGGDEAIDWERFSKKGDNEQLVWGTPSSLPPMAPKHPQWSPPHQPETEEDEMQHIASKIVLRESVKNMQVERRRLTWQLAQVSGQMCRLEQDKTALEENLNRAFKQVQEEQVQSQKLEAQLGEKDKENSTLRIVEATLSHRIEELTSQLEKENGGVWATKPLSPSSYPMEEEIQKLTVEKWQLRDKLSVLRHSLEESEQKNSKLALLQNEVTALKSAAASHSKQQEADQARLAEMEMDCAEKVSKMKSALHDVSSALKEKELLIAELREVVGEGQMQRKNSEEKINKLIRTFSNRDTTPEELRQELKVLEEERVALGDKLAESLKKQAELQGQLEEADKAQRSEHFELSALQNQHQEAKKRSNTFERKVTELEEREAALKKELASCKSELAVSSSKIKSLESAMDRLEKQLEAANNERTAMEEELEQCRLDLAALEKEEEEEEVVQVRDEKSISFCTLKRALSQATLDHRTASMRAKGLQSEKEELHSRIAQLELEEASKDERIASLLGEKETLEEALAEAENRLGAFDEEMQTQKDELLAARFDIEQFQRRVKNADKVSEALRAEVKFANDDRDRVQSKLDDLNAVVEDLRTDKVDLRDRFNKMEKKKDDLESELSRQGAKVASLNQSFGELEIRLQAADDRVAEFIVEREGFREQVLELTEAKVGLEKRVLTMTDEKQRIMTELEELSDVKRSLANQLASCDREPEVQSLKDTIAEAERETEELKKRLEERENRLVDVPVIEASLKGNITDLDETVTELRESVALLESELADLKEERNDLEDRFAESESDLADAIEEIASLKDQLEAAQDQLQEASHGKEEAVQDLGRLKEQSVQLFAQAEKARLEMLEKYKLMQEEHSQMTSICKKREAAQDDLLESMEGVEVERNTLESQLKELEGKKNTEIRLLENKFRETQAELAAVHHQAASFKERLDEVRVQARAFREKATILIRKAEDKAETALEEKRRRDENLREVKVEVMTLSDQVARLKRELKKKDEEAEEKLIETRRRVQARNDQLVQEREKALQEKEDCEQKYLAAQRNAQVRLAEVRRQARAEIMSHHNNATRRRHDEETLLPPTGYIREDPKSQAIDKSLGLLAEGIFGENESTAQERLFGGESPGVSYADGGSGSLSMQRGGGLLGDILRPPASFDDDDFPEEEEEEERGNPQYATPSEIGGMGSLRKTQVDSSKAWVEVTDSTNRKYWRNTQTGDVQHFDPASVRPPSFYDYHSGEYAPAQDQQQQQYQPYYEPPARYGVHGYRPPSIADMSSMVSTDSRPTDADSRRGRSRDASYRDRRRGDNGRSPNRERRARSRDGERRRREKY